MLKPTVISFAVTLWIKEIRAHRNKGDISYALEGMFRSLIGFSNLTIKSEFKNCYYKLGMRHYF